MGNIDSASILFRDFYNINQAVFVCLISPRAVQTASR
jgi:hypothetical protein